MIIRDKQELRRAVKQAVRRAEVAETSFCFDIHGGECGIGRMLEMWTHSDASTAQICETGTPFGEQPSVFFAALDALDMPTYDLNKARAIEQSHDRESYLGLILRAMKAQRVLTKVGFREAGDNEWMDSRFAPLLVIDLDCFLPERYGVSYERIAQEIADVVRRTGARDLCLSEFDFEAIKYCLIPVCEDEHCVLHLHVNSEEEISALCAIMDDHPLIHVIACAEKQVESILIDCAKERQNLLIRLNDPACFARAIECLGTRFIPYASDAILPEEMLGRWVRAKERIWQALYEAYLPLARVGFELTTDMIEQDVSQLFSGNQMKLYNQL